MEPPKKHGVVAILQDAQGRYLCIRRGLKLVRAPGYWCFVGGEVEPNEALEVAIKREVFEEIGISVCVGAKVFEGLSPNGEFVLHWFRVQLDSSGVELKLHPHEVEEARWLNPAEITGLQPILPTLVEWLRTQ